MSDFKTLVPIAEFWRAVELYLQVAYENAPSVVLRKIELLKSVATTDLYSSGEFELKPATTELEPLRLALRLGNRFYPHMKLMIQIPPKESVYLFAADTHDQHIRPQAGAPDYNAYCELMAKNKAIASEIESKWAQHGLPVFKTYLKKKLEQKMAQCTPPTETSA